MVVELIHFWQAVNHDSEKMACCMDAGLIDAEESLVQLQEHYVAPLEDQGLATPVIIDVGSVAVAGESLGQRDLWPPRLKTRRTICPAVS